MNTPIQKIWDITSQIGGEPIVIRMILNLNTADKAMVLLVECMSLPQQIHCQSIFQSFYDNSDEYFDLSSHVNDELIKSNKVIEV